MADKSKALLEAARGDFPYYYANSSPREKIQMDTLVLVTALVVWLNQLRSTSSRKDLEESCEVIKRAFTDLCEKVRASPTFASLPFVERWKIESAIFRREPPAS